MTLYKLTDHDGWCRLGYTNATQYLPGWTYCTDGLIHAYEDQSIAMIMNPLHSDFTEPRMLRCEGKIVQRESILKCGVRTLTVIEQVEPPVLTSEDRVRVAIFCAWPTATEKWRQWARRWLSGDDRSVKTDPYRFPADYVGAAARAEAYAMEAAAQTQQKGQPAPYAAWAAEAASAARATDEHILESARRCRSNDYSWLERAK